MKSHRTTLWAVGLFALAALVAMPAAADFVINDDLIVDGSACIGFDCVNGESFGFDTLRLKENNLRIKADDTSTAGSYPRNDWQLTFNASANGGAEKFSVDDITGNRTPFTIEAGARSHSLYVDDGGRIGIRTSTPAVEVHIIDGDTPTLRLHQDGSSGFQTQIWDVAGNETNFFIRDVSNGSTLPFRIRPGAATSTIDVDADGACFGCSDADEPVHIFDSSTPAARLENSSANWDFGLNANGNFQISEVGTGGQEFTIDENATGSAFKFRFSDPAGIGVLMSIEADGDVTNATGSFTMASDRNMKSNIVPVDSAAVLAKVSELPISTWSYNHQAGVRHMGPMAQDFRAAFGLHDSETGIALNDLSGVALAAIQGLNQQIEARDRLIDELLTRVSALEAKLAE